MKLPALLLAATLVLTGCAQAEPVDSSKIQIAVSTNVWADVAAKIGGDRVEVQALIDRVGIDPHSYEASARDQLAINQADLLIANGGGYDDFFDKLAKSSGKDVFHAFEKGLQLENEHIWYDLDLVADVAKRIAKKLEKLDSAGEISYRSNLAIFLDKITELKKQASTIAEKTGGLAFLSSEPLADYLLKSLSLENKTPSAFADAIEEERDIAPKTLLEVENILKAKQVQLFVVNEQTSSSQIEELASIAKQNNIPVILLGELLPEGEDYFSWMKKNLQEIEKALS